MDPESENGFLSQVQLQTRLHEEQQGVQNREHWHCFSKVEKITLTHLFLHKLQVAQLDLAYFRN